VGDIAGMAAVIALLWCIG